MCGAHLVYGFTFDFRSAGGVHLVYVFKATYIRHLSKIPCSSRLVTQFSLRPDDVHCLPSAVQVQDSGPPVVLKVILLVVRSAAFAGHHHGPITDDI